MKSIINRNKNLFLSFCSLILLPIAGMCLFGYVLSLLNGQAVESPALGAAITKVIGVSGLMLIYWLIKGMSSFWKQLSIAERERKAAVVAAKGAPAITAPVKQKKEKKKLNLPITKWVKVTARVMLILALAALAGMALTNPSYREFKAFTPERNSSLHYAEWREVNNYLLWSVYQKDVFERRNTDRKFSPIGSQQYRGMLLNFTPLQQQ